MLLPLLSLLQLLQLLLQLQTPWETERDTFAHMEYSPTTDVLELYTLLCRAYL
jgi:hypothetical protein